MTIKETGLEGLVEIFPRIFEDERGLFFEAYNQEGFRQHGIDYNFVQDNQSFSKKGVVRGLHIQLPPFAQAKFVKVITGRVLDVAVDVRPGSKTFGKYYTCLLDSKLNNAMLIPEGFAHGFAALEDSIFQYKCSNFYNKASETGIVWNDKTLNINWQVDNPIVSEKDQILPTFEEFVTKFETTLTTSD